MAAFTNMIRFILITLLLGLAPGRADLVRTWENNQGVRIAAVLVDVEEEIVVLRKGVRVYRVPVETLSEGDQAFLSTWLQHRDPTAAQPRTSETGPRRSARGTKKGYALATGRHPDWRERLQALNVSWFYTWSANPPHDIPDDIEFVPMVFGRENRVRGAVDNIKFDKTTYDFTYVLGHNEPDATRQANRTVEQVLDDWPMLMETDLPIVSPGAVHPDREWMKAFMEGVDERGLRVDFIAVHSYGPPNHRAFLNRLERIHRMYGRPIWITEFAVGDWQAETVEEHRYSQREVLNFMRRVLPELERRPYIYRYSWYSAAPDSPALGTSALFDEEGNLTPLGEFYSRQP